MRAICESDRRDAKGPVAAATQAKRLPQGLDVMPVTADAAFARDKQKWSCCSRGTCCNPLTRARKTLPGFDQTWEKVQSALEKFDVDAIRTEDIARASVLPAA